MGITEDIADELAKEALKAEADLDDDGLVKQMSDLIGTSSTTTQDAFLTAVRVRRSEARGRDFLARAYATAKAKKDAGDTSED